jgi:hypothetical protein
MQKTFANPHRKAGRKKSVEKNINFRENFQKRKVFIFKNVKLGAL